MSHVPDGILWAQPCGPYETEGRNVVAKLYRTFIVRVVLVASACLTVAPGRGGEPPEAKPSTAVATSAEKKSISRQILLRGTVVDEAGRPVAGAEVRADAFTDREARGVTKTDGSFAMPIRKPWIDATELLARSHGGDRVGVFRYGDSLSKEAEAPAQVVLKPGREVVVHVTDSAKAPVPGASVEVVGSQAIFDDATTARDGSARLLVPADAKIEWIVALKPGRGFDFAEYGRIDDYQRSQGGVPALDLPGSVALTLDNPRTVRIKAVDSSGKPLAGVGFHPWLLGKIGRRSTTNFYSRIVTANTGPDGVATFDWLPPAKGLGLLQFWPSREDYASRRIIVGEAQTGTVRAKLTRAEAIRGRVVRPDGSPAPGIQVRAVGSGQGMDQGQAHVRTGTDGSYEMPANPREVYAVYVDDKDWAAPSRLDVIIREGQPAKGVDFKLTRGTIVRGTVTAGPGNLPEPNQCIRLDEAGGEAPEEFRDKGDHQAYQVRRSFGERTDSDGRYSIRVGPGTYSLVGPHPSKIEEITVKNEAELVRDFHMALPEKGLLTGRVILPGSTLKGAAGAKLEVVTSYVDVLPFTVTADAEGRFSTERNLVPLVICAKNPDGTLGAMIEAGADVLDVEIVLAPTATATGLLVDEKGKPAMNQKLYWGRRVYINEERTVMSNYFVPKVVTDAEGRFTLPSLVIGQEYEISVQRENTFPMAGLVKPEKGGRIDLGTIQIGAYKPGPKPPR